MIRQVQFYSVQCSTINIIILFIMNNTYFCFYCVSIIYDYSGYFFCVKQVVSAADALSTALVCTEQLAAQESTSSLQLLADQRAKLMGLTEVR